MGELKRCTWCGESKDPALFFANKLKHDGKSSECKECGARKQRIRNRIDKAVGHKVRQAKRPPKTHNSLMQKRNKQNY